MTLKGIAHAFHGLLRDLSEAAAQDARSTWAKLDPDNLAGSWESLGLADDMLASVSAAQLEAADAADPFITAALARQAAATAPLGTLDPRSLAGIASDGRNLDSLLLQPVIRSLVAIGNGMAVPDALDLGAHALELIARTQVTDAGRTAAQVAMTTHPQATGWVRMLVPPSCGRCAILAGRVYRWSSGFDRHPGDDCVTVPASESVADDLTVDPDAYFASLTSEEQDRQFTKAGAQAIRDGANIAQVVNARRGAAGLSRPGRLTADEQKALRGGSSRGQLERTDVFGKSLFVTSEGTTRRGVAGSRLARESGTRRGTTSRYRRARAPRLMPEAVAEIAGDNRELRLELLYKHGYII